MEGRFTELHEWKIIEKGWDPENQRKAESIFSLGNGKMGGRANFEEAYSGDSLQGNYVGGIYYPDKTRVGWWKNGYPEYFAKVLNAPDWTALRIKLNGETLDLAKAKSVTEFERVLDMQCGLLQRKCKVELRNGVVVVLESERYLSMADDELGFVKYSLKAVSEDLDCNVAFLLDGDVHNEDSNYDERFWKVISKNADEEVASLCTETFKTEFRVAYATCFDIMGAEVKDVTTSIGEFTVSQSAQFKLGKGQTAVLCKYVGVASSLNHTKTGLEKVAKQLCLKALKDGYDAHLKRHKAEWSRIWDNCDVQIQGDTAAQQGIRFNIFQLNQTYTGRDSRLNIGPKGFTGEKYGGSTYWDTEAYCLPFYLYTSDYKIARQLLKYRYDQLPQAIENAEKLGFYGGAALYPMVTMNGEECHNEWEITFEEIHRNGAMAYAICNYLRHTNDVEYLAKYGLEVLIAITRFWVQRVNWSERKDKYVMLGVTGPNEYENNVNNNWYTNRLAAWCIDFTIKSMARVMANDTGTYEAVINKTELNPEDDIIFWQDVKNKMYYPYDEELDIFLQQDNFLDKDIIPADQIPVEMRPLNQHWSWDRILRSCYIKQADTLQGFYFFEEEFDLKTLEKHFNFYEPITVHESSLSPCVHVVLAARLGKGEKAYELYMRTARLDLDDYNREVDEGLHITSMAGTYMALVEGFGGVKVVDGKLHIAPQLPNGWEGYCFKLHHKGRLLEISVNSEKTEINRLKGEEIELFLSGKEIKV